MRLAIYEIIIGLVVQSFVVLFLLIAPAQAATVVYEFNNMGFAPGDTFSPLVLQGSTVGPTVTYSSGLGGGFTGVGEVQVLFDPITTWAQLDFVSSFFDLSFQVGGPGIDMISYQPAQSLIFNRLEYETQPVGIVSSILLLGSGLSMLVLVRSRRFV